MNGTTTTTDLAAQRRELVAVIDGGAHSVLDAIGDLRASSALLSRMIRVRCRVTRIRTHHT